MRTLATLCVLSALALIPLQEGGATPAVAQRCRAQTVRVDVADGHGSGIAAGRLVWTASHVVEGQAEATVTTDSGAKIPAKVIARGSLDTVDLAVLELAAGVSIDGPKWAAADPGVGERLYVVGCPAGDDGTVSAGIVANTGCRHPTWAGKLNVTDASAAPGSSGGGVYLQATGEVVGVLVGARHNNHCFFVPVSAMRVFAGANKLPGAN